MKAYYDRRAPEYDDWWLGQGLHADRERPGWEDELRLLEGIVRDFYCHLEEKERERFLTEARRVAPELVVVASIRGDGDDLERWEERRLEDGSRWSIYKRVFEGPDLAAELGGKIVFKGGWFVVVRA
ncbi:MAG TPA: hypothetical protein VF872_06630 [Gaiellaceae bacterium]